MRKILPILLLILGIGGGIGAGLALKPAGGTMEDGHAALGECPELPAVHEANGNHEEDAEDPKVEYVKLNNQFVVPVVTSDKVESLVVLSLSIEVALGRKEGVYSREPKMRDAFLQVLFDHANMGGFGGAFTNANNMDVLRRALLEVGRKVAGDLVNDVLIVDIARQDV